MSNERKLVIVTGKNAKENWDKLTSYEYLNLYEITSENEKEVTGFSYFDESDEMTFPKEGIVEIPREKLGEFLDLYEFEHWTSKEFEKAMLNKLKELGAE